MLVFKVFKLLIFKEGVWVMSLMDGCSKMSKSDFNEGSCIMFLDFLELIIKKIKCVKIDLEWGFEFGNLDWLEIDNLFGFYVILSGKGW